MFQKLKRWQNPEPNTKECISQHPAKMNTTESFHGWPSGCFLFLPKTWSFKMAPFGDSQTAHKYILTFTLGVCTT